MSLLAAGLVGLLGLARASAGEGVARLGAPTDVSPAPRDPALAEGDRERDAGALGRAGELYAQAAARDPADDESRRKHGMVLHELGLREEALARCREALALRDAAESHIALAIVLLDLPSGARRSPADRAEALEHIARAEALGSLDPMLPRLRCQLASEEQDRAGLEACVPELERRAPDHVMSAWHRFELERMRGDAARARAALDRAEALGMPAADAAAFRALLTAEGGDRGHLALALGCGLSAGLLAWWGTGKLGRRRGARS